MGSSQSRRAWSICRISRCCKTKRSARRQNSFASDGKKVRKFPRINVGHKRSLSRRRNGWLAGDNGNRMVVAELSRLVPCASCRAPRSVRLAPALRLAPWAVGPCDVAPNCNSVAALLPAKYRLSSFAEVEFCAVQASSSQTVSLKSWLSQPRVSQSNHQ